MLTPFISKLLFRSLIALALVGSFAAGVFLFVINNKCVDFSVLENYNPGHPSILLDDEGKEWARFQLDRREPITIEKMPQHLIQAFVAAEDWSFFNHGGISWKGILRSTLVNLYHGRIVQGASTITQQLVKLLFFDAKKTFKRKIQEQLFAIIVERQFTKEQILQTYLNHVYFGCGIYGVQAASQRFWSKNASELTLEESASLAAIVRSPGNYCPILAPLSCQKRRNLILNSMAKLGFITREQFEQARAIEVVVKDRDTDLLAPHLKETIRQFLENLVDRSVLYSGGLKIQTTLNRKVQEQAQKVFDAQFKHLRHEYRANIDGALITIDTKTGGIKALIGGFDFGRSKFNRALQARRQMGSSFKPIVYAAAMQAGMNFADTEIDEPIELMVNNVAWRPNNVYVRFDGQMTLAKALSYSNNIVVIKVLLKVGAHKIGALAQKCHLPGPFHPYPSLALGCVDATPKEVVGMFNIFANDGVYVEPHYIKWVKDRWGNKIFRAAPQAERVMPARISGQVTKALGLGLERLHKLLPQQKWVDGQAISKTGTTNDSRSCWFTGSTPELTTVVYVGRDDNQSMGKDVFPLRTAFPVWIGLHSELPLQHKKFTFDPSLRELTVDECTGRPVRDPNDPHAMTILVPS